MNGFSSLFNSPFSLEQGGSRWHDNGTFLILGYLIDFRARAQLWLDKLFNYTTCISSLSVSTRVFLFTSILPISSPVWLQEGVLILMWDGISFIQWQSCPFISILFLQSSLPVRGSVDIGAAKGWASVTFHISDPLSLWYTNIYTFAKIYFVP